MEEIQTSFRQIKDKFYIRSRTLNRRSNRQDVESVRDRASYHERKFRQLHSRLYFCIATKPFAGKDRLVRLERNRTTINFARRSRIRGWIRPNHSHFPALQRQMNKGTITPGRSHLAEPLETSDRVYMFITLWPALWPLSLSSYRFTSFWHTVFSNQLRNQKLESPLKVAQRSVHHARKNSQKHYEKTKSHSTSRGRLQCPPQNSIQDKSTSSIISTSTYA